MNEVVGVLEGDVCVELCEMDGPNKYDGSLLVVLSINEDEFLITQDTAEEVAAAINHLLEIDQPVETYFPSVAPVVESYWKRAFADCAVTTFVVGYLTALALIVVGLWNWLI